MSRPLDEELTRTVVRATRALIRFPHGRACFYGLYVLVGAFWLVVMYRIYAAWATAGAGERPYHLLALAVFGACYLANCAWLFAGRKLGRPVLYLVPAVASVASWPMLVGIPTPAPLLPGVVGHLPVLILAGMHGYLYGLALVMIGAARCTRPQERHLRRVTPRAITSYCVGCRLAYERLPIRSKVLRMTLALCLAHALLVPLFMVNFTGVPDLAGHRLIEAAGWGLLILPISLCAAFVGICVHEFVRWYRAHAHLAEAPEEGRAS